jgi:2-polyprenyl-3-methyl-5-hydroxy-6-metoxy-1,4-benzoquinol methylase
MISQPFPVMNSFNQLNEYIRAYRISQAIFSAYEIGLFDILDRSPQTLNDLIQNLNVSHRGLRPLLGVMISLDIISVHNDMYQISPDFAPYVAPSSGQYIGNLIAHEIHLSKRWQKLTRGIQSGKPEKKETEEQDESDVSRFIRAMSSVGRRSAQLFLKKVPFEDHEHVLDLGGGPGEYQKLLCEKYAGITVTLFDQADTIQAAREAHKNHPAGKRMKYKSGDFLKDELGGPYQSIILSNIVHIYDDEILFSLLQNCFKSLKKDGRVLIKDFILTEETEKKSFTHLFALHMLLSTESGKCYRYEELTEIMKKAGFTTGRSYQITETSLVVEGVKTKEQGTLYDRF